VCDALFGVLQCMVIGHDILQLILVDGREVSSQILYIKANMVSICPSVCRDKNKTRS